MSEYMKPDEFIKDSWQQESCMKGRTFPRLPSISREILQQMNQKIEESRKGKIITHHHTLKNTANEENYQSVREDPSLDNSQMI